MGLTAAKNVGLFQYIFPLCGLRWGEEQTGQTDRDSGPVSAKNGPHDKQTDNRMYIYTRNRGIIPDVGWTRNLTAVEECLAGIWFFCLTHCYTATKIPFIFSQKRNCARPQSQFPHSCFCERIIYSPRIGPGIFLQQNRQTDCGDI
jgi:hypothetical protein